MMTKASLAHQEEGESGEADPSDGHQRRLHGRVLAHPSGRAGERAEPLLREEKQQNGLKTFHLLARANVYLQVVSFSAYVVGF